MAEAVMLAGREGETLRAWQRTAFATFAVAGLAPSLPARGRRRPGSPASPAGGRRQSAEAEPVAVVAAPSPAVSTAGTTGGRSATGGCAAAAGGGTDRAASSVAASAVSSRGAFVRSAVVGGRAGRSSCGRGP